MEIDRKLRLMADGESRKSLQARGREKYEERGREIIRKCV